MPQPFLHILERKAVAQQKAGAAIPLRYNYDKPEKPRISRAFGYLARFFILFQTEKSSHEVVIDPLLYIIKIPRGICRGDSQLNERKRLGLAAFTGNPV